MSTDLVKAMIREARAWCHNKIKLDGGLSAEVVIIFNLCAELERAQPVILAARLAGIDVITQKEKS